MITYDEAKGQALMQKSKLDAVLDYGDAYVFYDSKAFGTNEEDNGIVVLKSTGEIKSIAEYMPMSTGVGKSIKY